MQSTQCFRANVERNVTYQISDISFYQISACTVSMFVVANSVTFNTYVLFTLILCFYFIYTTLEMFGVSNCIYLF